MTRGGVETLSHKLVSVSSFDNHVIRSVIKFFISMIKKETHWWVRMSGVDLNSVIIGEDGKSGLCYRDSVFRTKI